MSRRTLTRTVVALAACLIMAVAAASASAAGFVAGKYPASVVGKQTTSITFTSSFGTLTCSMPEITGVLQGPSESLTTSVAATTCGIFGEQAPIAMNGCTFTFHPGSGEGLTGTMDIGPSNCGPITISSKTYGVFKIFPKAGMAAVGFTNTETNSLPSVNIQMALNGLKCQVPGGEVKENCRLGGAWNATATNNLTQVSLQAVAKLPDGFFLTGKSGEAGNLPRFSAETFPVTVTGSQTSKLDIVTSAGHVTCNSTLSNEGISAATSDLELQVGLEKCSLGGLNATPKRNTCDFVLHVANSGPPYAGSLSINCSTAGDGIEFVTEICTQKFPAQTLGTAAYENVGSSYSRKVNVSLSGSSVQYSGGCGSGSNATVKGSWSLEGSH